MSDPSEWEERMRKYTSWAAILLFGLFALEAFVLVGIAAYRGELRDIVQGHFAATIGLPCAAGCSLLLVLVLRSVSGDIELKVLGFEFKGAAAPIIMWILCFLAITLGISKTWDLKSRSQGPTASFEQDNPNR